MYMWKEVLSVLELISFIFDTLTNAWWWPRFVSAFWGNNASLINTLQFGVIVKYCPLGFSQQIIRSKSAWTVDLVCATKRQVQLPTAAIIHLSVRANTALHERTANYFLAWPAASSSLAANDGSPWDVRISSLLEAIGPADCSIPKPSHYPFERWQLLPGWDSWCRRLWAPPRWWQVLCSGCWVAILDCRAESPAASWSATPPGSIPSIRVAPPGAVLSTLPPKWMAAEWFDRDSWGMCLCLTIVRSMILPIDPRSI